MITIKVEVTSGQYRYIREFARALGTKNEGDFLLAMALSGISYSEGEAECAGSTFLSAMNEFLVKRRIPAVDPDDVLRRVISSRPPAAFLSRSAKPKQEAA